MDIPATHKTTPKDFFLYLFGAITLYVSAITLVALLWQLINAWLPETRAYGGDDLAGTVRWTVSVLVVMFPAYVVAMWYAGKDVDRDPGKREMWVRRWFVWATLFIAGIVAIGDLVAVLYGFLGGEIALRFFMKAVAVAVVAGAVLAYHAYLLKREPRTGLILRKGIAVAASAFVLAAIVTGVALIGAPSDARARRNDQVRVGDLQSMQYSVTSFWELKQRLPEDQGELVDPANPMPLPTDPQTGAAYRYEKRGTYDFALCAVFEADYSAEDAQKYSFASYDDGISWDGKPVTWQHGEGENCFSRTIDPERYPPATR